MPLPNFPSDGTSSDVKSSHSTNHSASSANDLSSTVTLNSPLVARLLYTLSEQPSIADGFLYGERRSRVRRAVSDAVDAGNATQEIADVRNFLVAPSAFFDGHGRVNPAEVKGAQLAAPSLVDLGQEQHHFGLTNLSNGSNVKDGEALIGWFTFNRVTHETFLDFYEQITSNLSPYVKTDEKPLLFLWAFEREIGTELKLTMPETQLKMFQFDESSQRLRPVSFKIANLGDTSHAEYDEVLDRPPPCSVDTEDGGGDVPPTFTSTIVEFMEASANSIAEAADRRLANVSEKLRRGDFGQAACLADPKKRCNVAPPLHADTSAVRVSRAFAALSQPDDLVVSAADPSSSYVSPSLWSTPVTYAATHSFSVPPDFESQAFTAQIFGAAAYPPLSVVTPSPPFCAGAAYIPTDAVKFLKCPSDEAEQMHITLLKKPKIPEQMASKFLATPNNEPDFQQNSSLFCSEASKNQSQKLGNLFQQEETPPSTMLTRSHKRENFIFDASSSSGSMQGNDPASHSPHASTPILQPPPLYADALKGQKLPVSSANHNTKKSRNEEPSSATKGRGRRNVQ